MLGDSVAVSGSSKQGAEDQQVERSLQQLNAGSYITTHCVDILLCVLQSVYSKLRSPNGGRCAGSNQVVDE